MKTPYGLEIIESCLTCPLQRERLFCSLTPTALAGLDAISSSATYPRGAILFVEGQEPRGIFVLCNGRVKLSATSAAGKSLILRIAEAGEVIGLPGTISGQPYEATAEAQEPIQANFIPRNPFLEFLRAHGEVALRVAEALSDIYYATYREVRCLGLSGSVEEKLAGFLLDFAARHPSDKSAPGISAGPGAGLGAGRGVDSGPARAVLTLTHEEIADTIGSSRETVTRLFADFKRKGLVQIHGSSLVINQPGLKGLLES